MKKKSKKVHKSKRKQTDGETDNCTDTASPSYRTETSFSDNGLDQLNDNERIDGASEQTECAPVAAAQSLEQGCWSKTTNQEEKSREEEFDEYLADLLL